MQTRLPRLLLVATFIPVAVALGAQTPPDFSGHWEGSIDVPGATMSFEVDLARNSKGELAGTFGHPAANIKGLPLAKVVVEGRSIAFYARADQPLRGVLSPSGDSVSGTLAANGSEAPFGMTRLGEARIEAPPRIGPIARELEGTWNGTLLLQGRPVRLVLTMANQPDGSAIGRFVNVDEGRLEIPVHAITQSASRVTLDLKAVGGSYAATLNADGSELVGTFTQGALVAPLAFRRAEAGR